MPKRRSLSSSDEDVYHVGSCKLAIQSDLTDRQRVGYYRGHNQGTSQRGRGVGQWSASSRHSIINLILVNTRSIWSQYVR